MKLFIEPQIAKLRRIRDDLEALRVEFEERARKQPDLACAEQKILDARCNVAGILRWAESLQ